MFARLVLFGTVLGVIYVHDNQPTINYYVTLITEEIGRAIVYEPLPGSTAFIPDSEEQSGAVLGVIIVQDDQFKVHYYVKLITEETIRALHYEHDDESTNFKPHSEEQEVYGTFDYIVVGAGSAGAVIANRLTEVPENKVLVLEAGGHETQYSDIPTAFLHLQGSEFNWNYSSVPQSTSCLGLVNQRCPYPRGKGLGGTSIINAVMYVRGNKYDYDRWHNEGNSGWSYEDVLPYFLKSENSNINGDEGYHGKGGYLNVEYHKSNSIQMESFIEANVELERKIVDYNGREQLGVAQTQINTINGERCSTGRSFIRPILDRENLQVSTNSLAVKVLIDKVNKTAYGVLLSTDRKLFVAYARKEVIISAGAINSPQLLMLSGVGPAEHLLEHGIEPIQDLSVGRNFQDHPCYFTLLFETNHTETEKDLKQMVEEYLHGYGVLAAAGNSQGLSFLQSKNSEIPGLPDIEHIIIPSFNTNEYVLKAFRYTEESYNATYSMVDPSKSFSIYVALLHPKSRGTLKLKSNSPYDYPLIDPQFLSDADGKDIETLYEGIQLALELLNTSAFKKLDAKLIYNPVKVCLEHEYLSREYWYCQLRQLSFHLFHPVGTCKMGPDPRNGAVVDSELRVHGIKGLRVADASIIPFATSGHTNSPAIMIGEKASDLLKMSKY